MKTSSRLVFPLLGLLVACGRSDLGQAETIPSVVDLPTGGSGGGVQGGSGGSVSGGGGKGGSAGAVGGTAGQGGATPFGPGGSGGDAGIGGSLPGGSGGSPQGGTAGKAGQPQGGTAGTAGVGGGPGGSGGDAGAGGVVVGGAGGAAGGPGGAGGSPVGGSGGAGGGPDCSKGINIPDPECQSCIDAVCCGESQFCNSSDCGPLLSCLIGCGESQACQQKCFNAFSDGAEGLQLLSQCVEASCPDACGSGGQGGAGGGPGGSGGVGGAGGSGVCPGSLPLPLPECKNCLDFSCCGESQSCNADPQCKPLLNCVLQCGQDGFCQQQCVNSFPGGLPELQKLGECSQNAGCSELCAQGTGGAGGSAGAGGGPGGSAGSAGSGGGLGCDALTTGDAVCDSCYQNQCCDQGAACVNSQDCIDVLNCLGNCFDEACQQDCINQFPAGANILIPLIDCINGPCGSSCGGGQGGSGGSGGSTGFCGDGQIDPGEQCDNGFSNVDTSALRLAFNNFSIPIIPITGATAATQFYNYFSASSHTGYEELNASRALLYLDASTGQLSLIVHHGIDQDTSGQAQPKSQVQMKFIGPPTMSVSFADDDQQELQLQSPGFAFGNWGFNNNSDGGVLGGLPFPGDWTMDISPAFIQGISSWAFVDGFGNFYGLDQNQILSLLSQGSSALNQCRTDCTRPVCGDGRLDGGERCDDGNTFDGDSCSSDCLKPTVFQPL